jgi:hypothetical protein
LVKQISLSHSFMCILFIGFSSRLISIAVFEVKKYILKCSQTMINWLK